MLSRRKSNVSVTCWTFLFVFTASIVDVTGHFFGGSLSYKLEEKNGKTYAHVELFTAWGSGKGPCGLNCDDSNIGLTTRQTRSQMKQTNGIDYFGTFNTDVGNTNIRNLSTILESNYNEVVYAVDPARQWEQDFMKFSFDLKNDNVDLNFDGKPWHPIIQNGATTSSMAWHLQSQIKSYIRSDTGGVNNAPRVISKPVYRIKLGSHSQIPLTTVDPDGDYVKCLHTDFHEAGVLQPAKGVEVKDCKVYINATSSSGYNDGSWIAVAVILRDFNRKRITFGTDDLAPISSSLSYSTVQFLVNILTDVKSPSFVSPTLDNRHSFIIYVGSTWATRIYAQAANQSTLLEFRIINLDSETFVKSGIKDDSRNGVKCVDITWETSSADIGHHIFCISAIDDKGVDSDLLCFKLEVRENTFAYISQGGSHFFDVPAPGSDVDCEAGVTCLLPIFVRSSSEVKTISVGQSFTEESSISDVQKISYKGGMAYKATLSFSDPSNSFENICFNARGNKQATIASTCIHAAVQSNDPCESSPCVTPAECISDRTDGTFICNCTELHSGKFCEIVDDPCIPNPCANGICYYNHHRITCYCGRKPAYTGKFCETNINDCEPDSCNNKGICKDRAKGFDCDCYSRYEENTASNCTSNDCPSDQAGNLVCDSDKCVTDTCNGHGVCSKSTGCTCIYGYMEYNNCSVNTDVLPVTDVDFLESSPRDGGLHTCYIKGNAVDCQIPLYLVTEPGSPTPMLTIQTKAELRALVQLDTIRPTSDFQGITNVHKTLARINGNVLDKTDQYVCFIAHVNATDSSLCLQLEFVPDPLLYSKSIASVQESASVKFISPTLNDGSKVACNASERCMLMMFTEASGAVCENVLSPTKGVTVFPTVLDASANFCVTEVAFQFTQTQLVSKTEICFQSTKINYQQRCYEVETPSPACRSAPCQNEGHCFRNRKTGARKYQCICSVGYAGDRCEKGPCPFNDCLNGAYCLVNDGNETCLCKAGFYGPKCEYLQNPNNNFETSFTSTARPQSFQCVRYQTCSFTMIVERTSSSNKPMVVAGYVSPYTQVDGITVVKMKNSVGYYVNVVFQSAKEGTQYICIQTTSESGQNMDEVCIQVNVITDVSFIYGFKDRPHFVEPSLATNAELECVSDEQCHVIYHLTAGEGKAAEGISVTVEENGNFDNIHLYTTCDTIVASGGNCTVDVVVIPTSNDVGKEKQICIGTELIRSNTEGEQRCFKLTTLANDKMKGCQTLHCQNGGFCDGHQANAPVCYCPLSYSGDNCDQPMNTTTTSFLGDLSIPSDVHCAVGDTCSIPFETLIVPNEEAHVSFTYVDQSVTSYNLSCELTEYSNALYMGVTTFSTNKIGTYKACILSNDTSSSETDELCLLIHAVNGSRSDEEVDKTKPHFVAPTLPGDSSVFCSTSITCHIDLHFTNGDKFDNPNKCPTVVDTSTNKDGRKHIFSSRYGVEACTSDIVYIPPSTTETSQVCVQLALPGTKGEIRCFTINVVTDAKKEKIQPCPGDGTCNRTSTCEDRLVPNPMRDNCRCRIRGEPAPSKASESAGVPIAMIAGVGSGFVVCSGTVAALVICKMKRPKIDTVDTDDDTKARPQEDKRNGKTIITKD